MKIKLAISALLFWGTVASAQTVYSSNAVGFQKVPIEGGGQVLASTPFLNADATLPAIFNGQLKGGTSLTASDNIFCWNAAAQEYDVFFPLDVGPNDPNGINGNWIKVGTPGFTNDKTLNPGDTVWIFNREAAQKTVVLVGEVPSASSIPISILDGLNMIYNPYPADVDMVSSQLTTAGTAGNNATTSDNVFLWDAINRVYSVYFLAALPSGNGWVRVDNGFNGGFAVIPDLPLEPGSGMWYLCRGNPFTWNVVKPYNYP